MFEALQRICRSEETEAKASAADKTNIYTALFIDSLNWTYDTSILIGKKEKNYAKRIS